MRRGAAEARLAAADVRTDRPLAAVVGRIDAFIVEERDDATGFAPQAPGVGSQIVAEGLVLADAPREPASPGRIFPVGGRIVCHFVQAAQLGENPAAAPRYFRLWVLRKLLRLAQQVGQAALAGFPRPFQVDGKAVGHENSGPVADQFGKGASRTGVQDHEEAERGADQGPQPVLPFARRPEDGTGRLVHVPGGNPPGLPADGSVVGLDGGGGPVQAVLDSSLGDFHAEDLPEESFDLPPAHAEGREEGRHGGRPGSEPAEGVRRGRGAEMPAAVAADGVPDDEVLHKPPHRYVDHLVQGEPLPPGHMAAAAEGAFLRIHVHGFVRLESFPGRAGMAGPAGLRLRSGLLPAGGAAGRLLPLPCVRDLPFLPGSAQGGTDALEQAPAVHHERARRYGRGPVRVFGSCPEEAGTLSEEPFECRELRLRKGVLGAEKEKLGQGGKEEREEHRAPQGERAGLRAEDRQSLAAVR